MLIFLVFHGVLYELHLAIFVFELYGVLVGQKFVPVGSTSPSRQCLVGLTDRLTCVADVLLLDFLL